MPHSIGFGNDLLDTPPKAQVIKEKNFKLDFMKIKNFCASKDSIKKKRQYQQSKKATHSMGENM